MSAEEQRRCQHPKQSKCGDGPLSIISVETGIDSLQSEHVYVVIYKDPDLVFVQFPNSTFGTCITIIKDKETT